MVRHRITMASVRRNEPEKPSGSWRSGGRVRRSPGRRLSGGVVVLLISVVTAAGLWPPAPASAANSAALKRYPYVSEVVGNSARVQWATDRSATTGSVTWGAVSGGTCTPSTAVAATKASITVGSTNEYQWSALLTFPTSGTYCYRVQLAAADLLGSDPSRQVSTAAAPGSSYSFAVVGDWGAGTSAEANVFSQIGKSPANFVVTTGDNVYNSGTDTEYGDLTQGNVYPSSYLPAIGNRPIFASEGNHGFTTNLPYLQNFSALTAAQASGGRYTQESYCCISTVSGAHNYPSAWYAFNWGSARFYVLDAAWADSQGAYQGDFLAHWNGSVSGCGPCGAEMQWLKSDLAAHAGTPIKFAFFHYPLHSDNGAQSSDTYLDGPNGLEGVLANSNVDIAFNGHAHGYERNLPQIAGKPLVSYVTGSGGDALGGISQCSTFDAYAIGSSSSCHAPKPASSANVYGFLLVTVSGNKVTVTPTDSTGRTFDQQTYTYSGSTPTNDFSVSASPTSASVVAGSATTTTINTAVTSGSAQSVAFSASGLPTGALVSFTPSTVTAGSSSSLSITTASGTTPGPYSVTVTGTGTSATHATTFTLTVTSTTGSTPSLVQVANGTETASSTNLTGTFPTTTIAGHLLVLSASVYTGATNQITSVTDSAGDTWTRIGSYFASGHFSDGELWYAANAHAVSTVTVHTASAVSMVFQAQEYSGVATTSPLDGSAGTSATSTSANSGQASSASANELAVGFVAGHGNAEPITVSGSGYTAQSQQTSTGTAVTVVAGYKVLPTSGAQSFAGTFSTAMYWAAGVAIFRPGS